MSSPKKWDLEIGSRVYRALGNFPRKDAAKLVEVIHSLPANPYAGDIKKLGGEENVWRRRVGSYRLSYELYPSQGRILVFEVKRRTSTTY